MRAIYDIENYPNFFLCGIKPIGEHPLFFEISPRRDDRLTLREYIGRLSLMIGFNNINYDYPILHHVLVLGGYWQDKSDLIINSTNRFEHQLKPWEMICPQLDLFLIHHFDNRAKSTSLKTLEFNMRSLSIQDLPIAPGTVLTSEQMDAVIRYNAHDLAETEKFYHLSKDKIELRETLGEHTRNYNDTKLGKQFVIRELEKVQPGICYYSDGSPRQTLRPEGVNLGNVIFPYVEFETVEFNSLLSMFKSWTIHATKGAFVYTTPQTGSELLTAKDVSRTLGNFIFNFGTGGIHGSVKNHHTHAGDGETILDIDVVSFYPSIPITNRFAPAHLGDTFCDIYAGLKTKRLEHKKGSAQNVQLKYGLNGVYGDSNNQYSPFFDPQYTMKITINGQLLLCMLAEQLAKHSELIQVNTDGITIKFNSDKRTLIDDICKWWERGTCLDLEFAEYSDMWIRDVNNYIARKTDGRLKNKGAYAYSDLEWHKDHSALIVKRAAERCMVYGDDPVTFMRSWPDPFDFFILTKAPPRGKIITDDGSTLTKNTRLYVSTNGHRLTAVHPPLAGKIETRHRDVLKGRNVTLCNTLTTDMDFGNLDLDYYYQEIRKIVIR